MLSSRALGRSTESHLLQKSSSPQRSVRPQQGRCTNSWEPSRTESEMLSLVKAVAEASAVVQVGLNRALSTRWDCSFWSYEAKLAYSLIELIRCISSSLSAVDHRWHRDLQSNRSKWRFGYKDNLMHQGPLPRLTNESKKIRTMKVFTPPDPFAPNQVSG